MIEQRIILQLLLEEDFKDLQYDKIQKLIEEKIDYVVNNVEKYPILGTASVLKTTQLEDIFPEELWKKNLWGRHLKNRSDMLSIPFT